MRLSIEMLALVVIGVASRNPLIAVICAVVATVRGFSWTVQAVHNQQRSGVTDGKEIHDIRQVDS